MIKRCMSLASKINFLFRTVYFTQLLCLVLMLYYAEAGKGQSCLRPKNEGLEGIFWGVLQQKCHISGNTGCIALKFSGFVAQIPEKLTLQ